MAPASAPPANGLHTMTWEALGTTALLRHEGGRSDEIRAAVQRELDAIDRAASRFRRDSELMQLAAAEGEWTRVSPLLYEALALALRAADASDGAVDPTLGESLVTLGYDRDWEQLSVVSPDAPVGVDREIVVVRRRRPAWPQIQLRSDPPSIRVPANVTLDLGATAKALAADRAARAAATAADGRGVLVALGGDIATWGEAPAGGWQIHVTDDHRAGAGAPGQTISISSGGLATSSIATRRWRHAGRVQHHILNPYSGLPVRGPWRTASVAAATCADANIASTAAIVLGDDAPSWLGEHALPARLVAVDGAELRLNGWPQ